MNDRDYEPPIIEKAALALVHHQVEPSKPRLIKKRKSTRLKPIDKARHFRMFQHEHRLTTLTV
jgi:hypothetical protein